MCAQDGDLLHLMGIMNKQDYARWHSYEFMLSTQIADGLLRPLGHPEVISCCFCPLIHAHTSISGCMHCLAAAIT
jgi:hypothetical protein